MKTKLKLQNIFNFKVLNPFIFYRDNKAWFKICLIIFLLSLLGGIATYFYPEFNVFYPLVKAAFNDLSRVAEGIKDASIFDKALIIFLNNVTVAGLIILSGLFLGILPLFILILNGFVLGFFLSMIISSDITIYLKLLMILSLLPHGLIELYFVFTAISYSLKLGISHLQLKSKGNRLKVFFQNLKEAPSVMLFVVFGLSLAAIVEILDMIILKALVE